MYIGVPARWMHVIGSEHVNAIGVAESAASMSIVKRLRKRLPGRVRFFNQSLGSRIRTREH